MSEINSIENQILRVSERIKKMFPDFVGKPSGFYKVTQPYIHEKDGRFFEHFAESISYYNHHENAFYSCGGNNPSVPKEIGECVLETNLSLSYILANSNVYTRDEFINREH